MPGNRERVELNVKSKGQSMPFISIYLDCHFYPLKLRCQPTLPCHLNNIHAYIPKHFINICRIIVQKGPDDFLIHNLSTTALRHHKPQNNQELECIIKRDPIEGMISDGCEDVEECEYDPVHEPFLTGGGFKGVE